MKFYNRQEGRDLKIQHIMGTKTTEEERGAPLDYVPLKIIGGREDRVLGQGTGKGSAYIFLSLAI